jgi:biopolymer transport protein ExbD
MGLKRRNKVEPEFSLAAMIDVIFLLLMFFMLTSKFVSPNALNLQLPSSTATTVAPSSLAISIDRGGKYYLNAKPVAPGALRGLLQTEIRKTGEDPKQTTVAIVAEKGVPIENVVFLLDLANKLGVKAILATEPKTEG